MRWEGDRTPQLLNRGNCFERAGHDLAGASFVALTGQTRFKQLGVREDDAELIVQPVKDVRQIGRPIGRLRLTVEPWIFRRHG